MTRNGEPIAELRPFHPRRRTFVGRDDVLSLAANGARIDRERFREDIDRWMDPDL